MPQSKAAPRSPRQRREDDRSRSRTLHHPCASILHHAGPKPHAIIAAKRAPCKWSSARIGMVTGARCSLYTPARKARYSTSAPVPEPHGQSGGWSKSKNVFRRGHAIPLRPLFDLAATPSVASVLRFAANLLKLEECQATARLDNPHEGAPCGGLCRRDGRRESSRVVVTLVLADRFSSSDRS